MKHYSIWGILGLTLILQACCPYPDDFNERTNSDYEPVYLSRSEFENSVSLKESQPIVNSGKIYIKDNLLFINEVRKGFHIFDNTNPENPVKLKFLEVPGSTDLAVRESVFYINQATDLISARINFGLSSVTVTKRVEEVFPEISSPDGFYALDIPENSVVINWKIKEGQL